MPQPPSSVLIVKLSSMGDVLHTLPAARHLRAAFPQATLAWAVEEAHADLLRGQSWLDELIVWRRESYRSYRDFLRRLRRTRWDVAIDFQGIFRSAALVTRRSRARRRVGFAPGNELAHWFYNVRVPRPPRDGHAVEWYLQLAQAVTGLPAEPPLERPYLQDPASGGRQPPDHAASCDAAATRNLPRPEHSGSTLDVGCSMLDVRASDPRLWPRTEHRTSDVQHPTAIAPRFPLNPSLADHQAADAWLAERAFSRRREKLVILCPDARRQANRWPEEKWSRLAARLSSLSGIRVALSGGPASRACCDRIAAAAGDVWRADGQFRLLASAALFSRAACVVTGDTGPMHLAVAVGAKIVALLGPTNPRWTGPYASDAIVLTRSLPCSPCKTAGRCPLRFDPPRCMDEISVEETAAAVATQLGLMKPTRRVGIAHQSA
jgi:ADP-heptose:LPS heptosyltransferase